MVSLGIMEILLVHLHFPVVRHLCQPHTIATNNEKHYTKNTSRTVLNVTQGARHGQAHPRLAPEEETTVCVRPVGSCGREPTNNNKPTTDVWTTRYVCSQITTRSSGSSQELMLCRYNWWCGGRTRPIYTSRRLSPQCMYKHTV